MELLDLRIFEQVAREQSISRAAAGLHMAQPSVSQRLQALEAEVGRPLFRRHRRGVALTPEGQLFLEYVRRSLGLIAEGLEATRAAGAAVLRINVAGPPSIVGYFLPPLLRRLVEAGHDVCVYDSHSSEVMQMLLDGAIHAGFVVGVPSQPGIRQQLVNRDPILCVAAAGHPLAGRPALRMADLAGHRLAFYSFSGQWESLREAVSSALGAPPRGLVKTTPAESARAMALGGDFVTFMPRLTVARDLAEGRLTALPVTDLPPYAWDISVAYRERKEQGPEVRALLAASEEIWK